jgi:hypothetical protein
MLKAELIAEVGALRAENLTMREIGLRLGLTKNQVVGIINRHHHAPIRTLDDRLDAVHARFDAMLAECRPTTRHVLKEAPRVGQAD